MNCLLNVLVYPLILQGVATTFLHEHSYIKVLPGTSDKSDFGFTMGYWSSRNSLVIGAPHHDLDGKVFIVSMEAIFEKKHVKGSEIDIDMDKLAGDFDRTFARNQHFCLGASIAVTSDYVLVCAPLWTSKTILRDNSTKYGAFGTCFVTNGTTSYRYNGPYQQIIKDMEISWRDVDTFYGGSAWNTLVDEKNDVILVSMSPLAGRTDIGFMRPKSPHSPVQLMKIFSKKNWPKVHDLDQVFKDLGPFASGLFFGDKISYAYSSRKESMNEVIGFLQQPSRENQPWEVRLTANAPLLIQGSEIGSMFGAALSAADLNSDGFSDLLVGAPAQGRDDYYDSGALHILLGGSKSKITKKRTILRNKAGGRFATAIAVSDLDGDNLPEVFVGAPFEDFGSGAVYILDGREIQEFLKNSNPMTQIPLSHLRLTQRIANLDHKMFGYSLQPLPDLDGNGCNEVAVGAPKSGYVLVYRGIPEIDVTLSSWLLDREYVREQDTNFTVRVNIAVTYPPISVNVTGTLQTRFEILGYGASLESDPTFTCNLADKLPSYSKDVTVILSNEEPGLYRFKASVTLSDFDEYLKGADFDSSRIRISPHSYNKTKFNLDLERRCKQGEDCVPRLSASYFWTGRNKSYVLGSTTTETLTVVIQNDGSDTFESCAKILVTGSQVALIKSSLESSGWYQYSLRKPLKRHASDSIEIQLDMSKQSTKDKALHVKVALYNTCNRANVTSESFKEIPFDLDARHIFVNGFDHERNITDSAMQDPRSVSIFDDHEYTIFNRGTVTWKATNATIKVFKQPFFEIIRISTPEAVQCVKNRDDDSVIYRCMFDLERETAWKIKISFEVDKGKFMENLEEDMLKISSTFLLNLPSNLEKTSGITATFHYQKDTSWAQNETLVISTAVVAAALIIAVISWVLLKRGFFENKEKTKLQVLKNEIRKQSIKRTPPVELKTFVSGKIENKTSDTTGIMENEC